QGAALETARRMSLHIEHEVFVTMDSDGQHRASDLPRFCAEIAAGADVVFGSRFLGIESESMPQSRKAVLQMARAFERFITGLDLSDAHNGYRAFSKRAIGLMALRQNRMAHATEIKQNVAQNPSLVVRELPVEIAYTAETLHKGQSSLGAFNILRDLLYGYL